MIGAHALRELHRNQRSEVIFVATREAFDVLRAPVAACRSRALLRAKDLRTASQVLWAAAHGNTWLLIVRPTFPSVGRERLIRRVDDMALDRLLGAQPATGGGRNGDARGEQGGTRAGGGRTDG